MSSERNSSLDDDKFTKWIVNHKSVIWNGGYTSNGAMSIEIRGKQNYAAATYFTNTYLFVSAVLFEDVSVKYIADFDRAGRLANKNRRTGKFDLNLRGRFNGPLTYTSKLDGLGADVGEEDLDFLIRDVIDAVDRFRLPFVSIGLGNTPDFAMEQAGQELIKIDLTQRKPCRFQHIHYRFRHRGSQ